MVRWSTVRALMQGGPFQARLVRPNLSVRVLRVDPRGVVVEAQLPGEDAPREVLVKVGGLRCQKPPALARSLAPWVAGALQGEAQTCAALVDRALAEGVAVAPDAALRVAAALGRLSRQGRLASAGFESGPRGGKGRPMWRLRG